MSALPIQEAESVISELPKPKGPGARLKAARQARKLELDIVAAQLHLSHEMIVALEADDYGYFPARVFVVGYLKNYARHVGLPVEAILQAFNNYLPVDETQVELPRLGSDSGDVFKPAAYTYSHRRSFSWLKSLILLVAAIGAFFVWQKGFLNSLEYLLPAGMFDAQTSSQQTVEPLLPAQASLIPALPVDIVVAPAVAPDKPDSSFQGPGQQPETLTTADAVADENLPVKTIVPVQQPAIVADADIMPASTEKPAVKPVAGQAPEIIISFSQACWVDIRDSAGTFKYMLEAKAGTSKKITGKPPYKVLLGNVSGVSMTIDGEPFDLQRYNIANVARFNLDPSAL